MRHKVYGKHLGRDKNERARLFKNLVQSLMLSGSIETTLAKAKATKGLVDKIINQAKKDPASIHSFFFKKEASEKLVKDIAPRYLDRNSGYTSVIKLQRRLGDNATLVRMSLVESKAKSQNSKVKTASKNSKLEQEGKTS